MKIYVLHGGITDMHWIDEAAICSSAEEADVILFTGGTDVDPALYGDVMGDYTDNPDEARDIYEASIFREYSGKKPMIGICRGSQFLCVMSGGQLIQHMRHPGNHIIYAKDKTYLVNSTHHQMMYPFEVPHVLLGYAQLSPMHLNGSNEEAEMPMLNNKAVEPEVVWFSKTKCLCIQSHPEYTGYPAETGEWLNQLINKYVKANIHVEAEAAGNL